MKNENEQIWQVVTYEPKYTTIKKCYSWFTTEEKAKEELEKCLKYYPTREFWIEKGTDHIRLKCRGCSTVHCNLKYDAYGIETGYWCEDCYNSSKYPYRKDRYDYAAFGERLDDED